MQDFSNVKLDKRFRFNDENVKWLIYNISFGNEDKSRPQIYCGDYCYHDEANWCRFSPQWLFYYTFNYVHFEVTLDGDTWKLQLHFEHYKRPYVNNFAEQALNDNSQDHQRTLQDCLFTASLLQHLKKKLPEDKVSKEYQWEDKYCLTFRPHQPLRTLDDILEQYHKFHQLIVEQLRGDDLPPLIQGVVSLREQDYLIDPS